MRPGIPHRRERRGARRITTTQLGEEMPALPIELAARHRRALRPRCPRDPTRIEFVAPSRSFIANHPQIRGDEADGCPGATKPIELGMPLVALRAMAEDGLGQERLAPERDEPA